MRRLVLALAICLGGCAPGWGAGLQTANNVLAGAACGVAAANHTPCTPSAALARLEGMQREIVEAMARLAAANGNTAKVEAIMQAISKLASEIRALTEQVEAMAAAAPAPAPTPTVVP